jgi:tetratricopeptide (TPR) repeat protein
MICNPSTGFFIRAFALTLFFVLSASFVYAQTEDDETEDKDNPVKLFEEAQDAHEKGDLLKAIKLYDEAIKLAPEFPEAEFQRANALLSLNRFEEAEKGFRRAIEFRSDWSLPQSALGSLLVRLNRFEEAEKVLDQALKLDANSFPALVAMTEVRLRQKASKELLLALMGQLRRATTGPKAPASVWAARGAVERALGDKTNAKLSLDRALSVDPRNFNALIERAELYEESGDYERALSDAQTLKTVDSKASIASLIVARVYAKMGKNEEAMRVLDSLDEKTKQSSEAQRLRASLVKCDNTPEARAALEKFLEKESTNASLLACLGGAYRTVNPARSLELYRRAAELEPKNIGYATGYAAALVQMRKFNDAIIILRRIIKYAPDDYAAHANLATALYEEKLYPEALVEFGWLAAAKPDIPITYFFIATAHDYMQEYKDALAAYEKFLSLADQEQNKLEIEKVNLRLTTLRKQVGRGEGKKRARE